MDIKEIEKLLEKFAGNFGGEDLLKVKENGEDLLSNIEKFSGGLAGLAKVALAKTSLGNNIEEMIDKYLGGFGALAKTDGAKADLGNLEEAIKKFIGK